MLTIAKNQAIERWDMLPLVLREALYSDVNSDFIWKTCEAEHIPNEKIYTVSRIGGYVLMGFLHPEDMTNELVSALGIDKRIAASIQSALNQRIFAPLRKEIDTIYAPLSKFETGPKIVEEAKHPAPSVSSPVGTAIDPKMILENFKVSPIAVPAPKTMLTPTPTPAPQPKPQPVFSQTMKGLNVSVTPSAPVPQASKPTSDKGWSRQTGQDPVVKLGVITPSVPSPKPPVTPPVAASGSPVQTTPASSVPSPKPAKSISEFERLDMMKKGSTVPAPTPTAPKPPIAPPVTAAAPTAVTPTPSSSATSLPPPVMLHQVSPSSVQNSPDFRINTGIQNQINKMAAPAPAPNKPAVIEFGGASSTPTPTGTSKVVHYTEDKTQSTGPRNITEITPGSAPAPAPRSAVPAPLPPKPPAPPQAQSQPQPPQPTTKVVVKDFL